MRLRAHSGWRYLCAGADLLVALMRLPLPRSLSRCHTPSSLVISAESFQKETLHPQTSDCVQLWVQLRILLLLPGNSWAVKVKQNLSRDKEECSGACLSEWI